MGFSLGLAWLLGDGQGSLYLRAFSNRHILSRKTKRPCTVDIAIMKLGKMRQRAQGVADFQIQVQVFARNVLLRLSKNP